MWDSNAYVCFCDVWWHHRVSSLLMLCQLNAKWRHTSPFEKQIVRKPIHPDYSHQCDSHRVVISEISSLYSIHTCPLLVLRNSKIAHSFECDDVCHFIRFSPLWLKIEGFYMISGSNVNWVENIWYCFSFKNVFQ